MSVCRNCKFEHSPLMRCEVAARIRASNSVANSIEKTVANVVTATNNMANASTYRYRDVEARKLYQRDLMRKRRAEKRA